jgi:Asp-tRNA(Asn)/Glu-tRNA(Gln) amidotransferase C subunit
MTRGWFTEDQFIRGPDGIHTLASGLVARTFLSDLDSGSAGSAVMDGAGRIGDSIGMAGIQSMAATGTTPRVERSTTETISTMQDADLTATADTEPTAVEFTTTREQSLNHLTEITRLREDTRNPTANRTEIAKLREDMRNPTVDRATFTRERLAGTIVADRSEVIPRVAMPASVAEASMEAAEAVAFMAVVAAVVADADGGYFIL